MDFGSRRRAAASEGTPLEMDYGRCSYSTFNDQCSQRKAKFWVNEAPCHPQNDKSLIQDALSTKYSLFVVALVFVSFVIFHHPLSSQSIGVSIPHDHWDLNHHNNWDTELDRIGGRNMLIIQLSSSRTQQWSEVTSRTNRAYAKHWAIDYFLKYGDDTTSSQRQDLLRTIYDGQKIDTNVSKSSKYSFSYDSVMFLSPDGIISDMEFNLLSLLPEKKLVTLTNDERFALFNLRHPQFPVLLTHWKDSSCGSSIFDIAKCATDMNFINVISISSAGFVEPKLIKFLIYFDDSSIATLHTTADSVCYRFYPWCEVF